MLIQLIEYTHKHLNIVAAAILFTLLTAIIFLIVFKFNSKTKVTNALLFEDTQQTSGSGEVEYYIDLSGAVKKPGLYKISKYAHLADLIGLGGGFSNTVDAVWVAKNINLASHLRDSQKVYIPFEWDTQVPLDNTNGIACDDLSTMNYEDAVDYISNGNVSEESTVSDNSLDLININTATAAELDSLPGIGTVYVQKIISNRPYINAKELVDKAKIPQATVSKLEALIRFND